MPTFAFLIILDLPNEFQLLICTKGKTIKIETNWLYLKGGLNSLQLDISSPVHWFLFKFINIFSWRVIIIAFVLSLMLTVINVTQSLWQGIPEPSQSTIKYKTIQTRASLDSASLDLMLVSWHSFIIWIQRFPGIAFCDLIPLNAHQSALICLKYL